MELMQQHRIYPLFTPYYSSRFNSVEYLWGKLKPACSKAHQVRLRDDFVREIKTQDEIADFVSGVYEGITRET